jgi:hypothetical protein
MDSNASFKHWLKNHADADKLEEVMHIFTHCEKGGADWQVMGALSDLGCNKKWKKKKKKKKSSNK